MLRGGQQKVHCYANIKGKNKDELQQRFVRFFSNRTLECLIESKILIRVSPRAVNGNMRWQPTRSDA